MNHITAILNALQQLGYKNPKGVPVSADGNPQMMLYALGALKLYRPIYGDAIKRVTTYIDQPRLDSYTSHSMTVDELLAWGENTVKPKATLAFAGLGTFIPAITAVSAVLKHSAAFAPMLTPHEAVAANCLKAVITLELEQQKLEQNQTPELAPEMAMTM